MLLFSCYKRTKSKSYSHVFNMKIKKFKYREWESYEFGLIALVTTLFVLVVNYYLPFKKNVSLHSTNDSE